MAQPIISIIIPVYNAERYLGRCIDSIINQSFTNWELILVDDGSKDKSAMLIDEFAKTDRRLYVVHKKNGGVSSARNTGLDVAKGKYLIFVDADDYLEPDALHHYISNAKEGIQVISGYRIGDIEVKFESNLLDEFASFQLLNETPFCCCGYIWHRLFERELIGDLRFCESLSYGEDAIFWFNYIASNQNLYCKFVDNISYNYNKDDDNSNSLTRQIVGFTMYVEIVKQMTDSFNKIIEKHTNAEFKRYLSFFLKDRVIKYIINTLNNSSSQGRKQMFKTWQQLMRNNVFFCDGSFRNWIIRILCESVLRDNYATFRTKIFCYRFSNKVLSKLKFGL